MDGGSKLSAIAPGKPISRGRSAATIACAECALPGRSAHGFKIANAAALLDCCEPVRKLSPVIATTSSTSGCSFRMARICLTTSSVRVSAAPSGNCTTTKK